MAAVLDAQPLSCVAQIIAVSLMVGSLFFRLTHGVSDARSFYGAAFMVILFMSMGSMPQIGMVMAQKGVSLKHRDSLLYPGYAHGAVSRHAAILCAHLAACSPWLLLSPVRTLIAMQRAA
jgi:hypothetical protein